MIFVTVGTHEQQFDRLVSKVDELKSEKLIDEDVMIQIGFSNYIPKNCNYSRFLEYDQMKEYLKKADIVITHGGPATFMSVIKENKIPIVVPRLHQYAEHVNNHQLDFALKVKQKGYTIEVVEDIESLLGVIRRNSKLINPQTSNSDQFVNRLKLEIDNLFR